MSAEEKLKQIVEAALLAAGRPLSLDQILGLFDEREQPEKKQVREVLEDLMNDYQGRGIEVVEVGSGFRIQVRAGLSHWVSRLWAERPPKYSRALLETLALIAYRQPITRGEIEDIRGVAVSSNIIKTLTEREWVRVVGHRDVPGKPALYATTKEFLDYFNLKGLNDLPTLAEIRDLDSINRELELSDPDKADRTVAEEAGVDAETDGECIAEDSERLADAVEAVAHDAESASAGLSDAIEPPEAPSPETAHAAGEFGEHPSDDDERGSDAETDEDQIAEDSELLTDEVDGEEADGGHRQAPAPSVEHLPQEATVEAADEPSAAAAIERKKPENEHD